MNFRAVWNTISAEVDFSMNNKIFSKIIRVITVAPVWAAIMSSVLYFCTDGGYKNLLHYIMMLVFLTAFPLLPYPISLVWQKSERRSKQRSLAIIFSVVGYAAGLLFAIFGHGARCETTVYLSYLLSGCAIALSSFVIKKKASGHTCGISGPIAILCYYVSPWFVLGALAFVPIVSASLKMKRHTKGQLLAGALIGVVCFFVSLGIMKIMP